MKKLWKKFSEDWPIVITGFLIFIFLIYAYGCKPKAKSLLRPSEKVTREELNLELDTIIARHKMAIGSIEEQERFRQYVFQQTLNIAARNPVSVGGVLTGLLAIIGVGASADDVRLRRQRKKRDNKPNTTPLEIH